MADQSGEEHICAETRDQRIERDFRLNAARGDAGKEEGPIRRIPGGHFHIRQQRITGEHVRRPERQRAGVEVVGEIFLERVMEVGRVPLDAGPRRC